MFRELGCLSVLTLLVGCQRGTTPPAPLPVRAPLPRESLKDPAFFTRLKATTTEAPTPVGTYASGCLLGAVELERDGKGFERMRLQRNRGWGHPDLLALIKRLAEGTERDGATLLVGDMGQPRGGPMNSGHKSHQVGLDVDLWFTTLPAGRRSPSAERESLSSPSMVAASGKSISRSWGLKQIALLKRAAEDSVVERIFVNPVVKRELCSMPGDHAWVRKLRPWWGHDSHFHVRISCPKGASDCESQTEALPEGDGCGAEVASWFGPNGRVVPPPPSRKEAPSVPSRCLLDHSA